MRIIAGIAGSIPLKVPRSLTRPTTDRVREAIFSALGDLVIGARVLDLFAGSGSLGIEALSRGATRADFVESHGAACTVLSENLEKSRLSGGHVHRRDVPAFLSTLAPSGYDILFADPPYARDEEMLNLLTTVINHPALPRALSTNGILVLETLDRGPLPSTELWDLAREKSYGSTRVSYLTPREL
ncbi:MAG: 16S rRNA (guanine(966)-N(2))-methyltransferase RsmD [Verrucomicrobiales bacterium]|jgi:16S rRNA (guanine966-N2)-methyltransferase|nr:16S rRNA (guanine(966)-N(2))-methyltransferase RsmD [Verrucomicrobiales bacterium]MBP9225343.1 16S rRNA (guanine(966)-N(2))-methyltransferase RsmD [Verrucomicrobiales bacterium]